jgi:GTPase
MAATIAEVLAATERLPAAEREALLGWLLDRLGSAADVVIDEVFDVRGRGGPVAGVHIKAGTIAVGDALLLDTPSGVALVRVGRIDMFQETVPSARVGESVGLELVGVSAAVARGSKRLRGFGVRA